jgi:hypothetical protein
VLRCARKARPGEDHSDALDLLARVRRDGDELTNSLRPLLGIKTRAGDSHQPVVSDDRKARVFANG